MQSKEVEEDKKDAVEVKEIKKKSISKKVAETNKKTSDKKTDVKKSTKKGTVTKKEPVKEKKRKVEPQKTIGKEKSQENINEDTQVVKKEQWISLKEIKKTITAKNNLPKEENEKINRHLFQNIMVAIVIMVYFIFLNLGKNNIQNTVFVTDLKVFGMCIMLLAIALMEKAYKEDSGRIAVFAIEMIVLSLTTVLLIYIDLIFSTRFEFIVTAISYIFAIYYLIKSIIIYLKKRKKYFVDDMKEIIKGEEEE